MRTVIGRQAISLSLLALFMGLSCSLIGRNVTAPQVEAESVTSVEISDTLEDEGAPYQAASLNRDEGKIILKSVEPAKDGNLARVTMLMPLHLTDFMVLANDIQVGAVTEGKYLVIDLIGLVSAREVTFIFQADDTTLANCTIMMDELLSPEGDCSW